MDISEQLERAYKKLKASVYFDKTQLILRDKVVEYEEINDLPRRFYEIAAILTNDDNEKWKQYQNDLLGTIDVLEFPKKLSKDNKGKIIVNESADEVVVDELQHFIDIDVEGQILGVFWILTIGILLDKEVYEHSYGNRLKRNLIKEDTNQTTFSPYLFKPYFEQYESWRNNALSYAEKCIDNKQDVFIFTMDFKRFFYSVKITEDQFDNFFANYSEGSNEEKANLLAIKRINKFVFKVMKRYSKEVKWEHNKDVFLPIGFFPSNIISNWYLGEFDSAISNRWNPVYYGRYVDDIIIVDKIEKNSEIYKKAKDNSLTQEEVINYFLCRCRANSNSICEMNLGLLVELSIKEKKILFDNDQLKKVAYKINNSVLHNKNARIVVQNDKVKVFYFKAGGSKAVINNFRKTVNENKSEFRYMPDDNAILHDCEYSEIYELKRDDSVNKFRSIDSVSINKYSLSKFLGKYRSVSCLIKDKRESKFESDILKIFTTKVIVDGFIFWERVIEILILNDNFELAFEFIKKIVITCSKIRISNHPNSEKLQSTMIKHLHSSYVRVLSLSWGAKAERNVIKVSKLIQDNILVNLHSSFEKAEMLRCRQNYCVSRMCNKYVLPSLIDIIIGTTDEYISNFREDFNDKSQINLSDFNSFIKYAKHFKLKNEYIYYPYLITLQELEMCLYIKQIYKKIQTASLDLERLKKLYVSINYRTKGSGQLENVSKANITFPNNAKEIKLHANQVRSDNKLSGTYSIAIANAKLESSNLLGVLTDKPIRSYKRYQKLASIVKQAIKEKAEVLIMPEAYVPFEWLQILARTASKNKMAIITGVEHIKVEHIKTEYDKIMNYTAVILPYIETNGGCSSHIILHNKVHYSPEEKRIIEGYGCKYVKGDSYDLICYNDLWFSVYCCFELSSITDRSLFATYTDATIAVEWNQDTNYYSNIIESLGRDLHCYCIQVNTSDYGDSRIVKPSRTEEKDIVRTKGGRNDTVLMSEIDVYALRKFQIKEFELQKDDKSFKPTPPDFDRKIVKKKIDKELWEYIKSNFNGV